jgi:hypothetical protein
LRCQAITRGGERCSHTASAEGFCHLHDPARAEERRRNSRRGGRARGNGRLSAGAEIAEIKRDIRGVIDAVAAGEQRHGATLFMGFHALLRAAEAGRKIKETDELERRIEQLEALDAEAGRTAWHR